MLRFPVSVIQNQVIIESQNAMHHSQRHSPIYGPKKKKQTNKQIKKNQ